MIRAAFGQSLPNSDRKIAQLVQVVWDLAPKQCSLELAHAKAHAGHLWNVWADNVAKATARQLLPVAPELPRRVIQAVRIEHSRLWEWVLDARRDSHAYPSVEYGNGCVSLSGWKPATQAGDFREPHASDIRTSKLQ
eukprot:1153320-Pyramimonas_sp.AAC.1